ncbi:MAG TPA: beta-ketoacyl-ACP synthase 3 [Pseudonocardiaceae bacterium]|nr:beta-ketoacyl-ACP synthase 3 [Pseudonocardiaceae bacterium]
MYVSGSRVISFGHYQPSRLVTNQDLSASLGTSDEWISERIGVRTRRIAGVDESVADMAAAAAAKALSESGFEAATIDLVVVATCTSVDRMPSVAARVAERIGATTPGIFDLNAACSGFSTALATADHAIRAGAASRAIVVGVDKMSDFLDWNDRSSAVIFGDGAGAAVVEAAPDDAAPGIGPVVWGSDPANADRITMAADSADGPKPLFRQEGQSVFRWATTTLAPVARLACERAGVAPSDLGGIVTHQANLRIINAIAGKIGATDAVLATDVVESGNTSAASIPLALSKLIEQRSILAGAEVLLFGFGAGLSYAGQVIRCP